MGWIINNQQLQYDHNGQLFIPSSADIYAIITGEPVADKSLPPEISAPSEALNIRYSRIGAQIVIKVDFDEDSDSINLYIMSRKGRNDYAFPIWENILPDSLLINNTWYNLLANHDDTQTVLDESEINRSGSISLKQYIRLKRAVIKYPAVILEDNAEEALDNHPSKTFALAAPASLRANLYPYQSQGFRWMRFISKAECGCILGDEMGLGKTLQVIALITQHKESGKGPALVIAPVSLLENWKREISKFTVGVNAIIHHGAKRTGLYTDLQKYDVVIISYGTAISDQSLLRMIFWDLLVVDEAQNIKNPSALRTRSIKNIPRTTAIAVTGTPLENHVSDLWSLMDFIAPGCFGTLSAFEKDFSDDVEGARQLEPYLSPLMLRRRVSDVAQDLPERIDIPVVLAMDEQEAHEYEAERESIIDDFDGKNATLPMLQKLRMYCTHPSLLHDELSSDPEKASTKYQRLCEILEEIVELDEKAILFTSYNKMFDILSMDIPARFGIRVLTINGSTPPEDRQLVIDRFTTLEGSALLVLNPRAAGTGLNITAASRVIHYNLEWNPALEDQASARAYRRGQNKTVFIYRLYYKDTIEEIINERIDKKRAMCSVAIVGTDGTSDNSDDIMRALLISPGGSRYEQ